MPRKGDTRRRLLDAAAAVVRRDGARALTLDAVAAEAGVSKGGLLYHFATKEALETSIIDRLHAFVAEDVAAMTSAPEGPIAYFLRSSAMENDPIDRAILAASRLAQGGNAAAADALRGIRDEWADVLRPHTKDATALDLVMLVSDGLYFNNALAGGSIPGPVPRGAAMDALVEVVERATRG
jgi:AcrR family transcriptional regulator